MKRWMLLAATALLFLPASSSAPQRGGQRGGDVRRGVPDWEVPAEFRHDTFTFVRIEYSSYRSRWSRLGDWATDWPDSDLNFSFRLQQLTSLAVDPDGVTMPLTDARLFDHPFAYLIEPGELFFDEAEVKALRKWCYNGGFLMVDDFWGDDEWDNFAKEFRRVFPDRAPVELPLEHEIFHCVYDLKEKPQVPSIGVARGGRRNGVTWESRRGSDTSYAQYKAIHDDDGRIMVLICFNTDLGDGWEREGEDEWFFHEFSEKRAYPMGINIVTYALTH